MQVAIFYVCIRMGMSSRESVNQRAEDCQSKNIRVLIEERGGIVIESFEDITHECFTNQT